MKVLAPIDFSEESINALNWLAHYTRNLSNVTVHLLHVLDELSYSKTSALANKLMVEKSESELIQLTEKFIKISQYANVEVDVIWGKAAESVCKTAKQKELDLMLIGSDGNGIAKGIFESSFIQHQINRQNVPVMVIPLKTSYWPVTKIVMAIGDEKVLSKEINKNLSDFVNVNKAAVEMLHVSSAINHKSNKPFVPPKSLGINYNYTILSEKENVLNTINAFCKDIRCDLLCLIHSQKNGFLNYKNKSVTEHELKDLPLPLLIYSV